MSPVAVPPVATARTSLTKPGSLVVRDGQEYAETDDLDAQDEEEAGAEQEVAEQAEHARCGAPGSGTCR